LEEKMSESGFEKSIRRIVTTVVFVIAGVLLYLGIRALAHWLGGITLNLPDLSNHDFEWLVLAFLLVITVNNGGSCSCKCK
jgi:NhaP-type Na+/H+ or K+/H+ antiporter